MQLSKSLSLFAAAAGLCLQQAQAQMPNTLKPAQKVYGLSKFWQEVNYNFVYLNKVDRKAWDSLYTAMIPVVQNTANDYEYYHELDRFCAFLNDGHTNIFYPPSVNNMLQTTMFGKYRLFLENIEDKAIITHINPAIKEEVPVGSEVIEVNGLSTASYLNKNIKPYIASSTTYVRDDNAIYNLLRGTIGQSFTVKIKTPKGVVKTLVLTHGKTDQTDIYPALEDNKLLNFKWYPGQVAYVSLNSFDDSKIDSLFIQQLPELYKAKSLIIDLRSNGGGNTAIGAAILDYLTNDKVLYGSKMVSRLHVPSFKAWGAGLKPKDTIGNDWAKKAYLNNHDERYELISAGYTHQNKVETPKIVVPTVILLGHNTASSAEDFLILADKQQHMVKIGQNSYGSTGQPYSFDLPGGGKARICTKKDTYPDGRAFVGYGVKPDIEVIPTVKDFLQGNDAALNKALSFLKGKTVQSILQQKKSEFKPAK